MKPRDLLAALEALAEAPRGVDRLREIVRQLAVSGRLVRQNPEDEPASLLLDRIEAEKARRAKAGALRDQRDLAPSPASTAPGALPGSWVSVHFGTVFLDIITGPFGTSLKKSHYVRGGVPVVNPQNLVEGRIVPTAATCVSNGTLQRLSTFCLKRGDIVVARRGEMGRCAVVTDAEDGWLCGTGSLILRPPSVLNPRFVALYLGCPRTVARLSADSVGSTMQNLNQRIMLNLVFDLPPLPEQHRIVARVEELMSLLDRLEAARAKRETTRAAARDSVLAALREAESPAEVDAAWTRFAQRMDDLVCATADIAPLRQTVLQLAVRGRLVRQDSRDEPAGALLARIATASAGPRRAPQQGGIPEKAIPFCAPAGWQWAQFSDVASIASNLVDPIRFASEPHVAPDNIEKGTGRLLAFRTIGEDGVTSGKHRFKAGQILYSKIRPNLSKVVMVDFAGLCSADMYPIDPRIDRGYLFRFMLSPLFIKQVTSDENRLAMPKVNQQQLSAVLVPIPPLAEQLRIAARVGELMTLLERFESRLTAGKTVHEVFAAAAVHHLGI